jgi:hypothetical protein
MNTEMRIYLDITQWILLLLLFIFLAIYLYKENRKITYYYKGKPYKIVEYSKIKLYDEMGMNGSWHEVVIYRTLYDNPDGKTWVRFKDDFESHFKTSNNI